MDLDYNIELIDTSRQEIAILGELICAPENIPDVMRLVKPEAFTNTRARELYEHILGVFASGRSDSISLASTYATAPDKKFYREYVMKYQPHGTIAMAAELTKALTGGQQARDILEFASELNALAHTGATYKEAQDLFSSFEKRIADGTADPGFVTMSDATEQLLSELSKTDTKIHCGYPSLDKITDGGFSSGDLVILAARPSVGKTAMALDMACFMAEGGAPGIIFTMEMKASQLGKRALLRTGLTEKRDFKSGSPNIQPIEDAKRMVDKLPIYIKMASLTIDEIAADIILMHSQGKVKWVVVDYIGLVAKAMEARTRNANRAAIIGQITGRLKGLAIQLDIPIIALCQLNRDSVKNGVDRAPELSDLRDSGEIEQDADIVLMAEIARDIFDPEDDPQQSHYRRVWVRKNRNGVAGDYGFILKGNDTCSHFEEDNPLYSRAPGDAPAAPATPAPADSPADFENVEHEF